MSPFASDPYCYPSTDVLRNRENLRDQNALDAFEADAVAVSLVELKLRPIQGAFDTRRLQETHRRIFGKVYPWAGELRRDIGMMAKTRASGFVVAYGPSANVPGALANAFAALKKERYLAGLAAAALAERLAYYYSELDAIHSFRDGNSRTLRVFTSDLAEAAGQRLDWAPSARTEADRERLYQARDVAVMRGETADLARILAANLRSQS
jgi:cell filamentation protein